MDKELKELVEMELPDGNAFAVTEILWMERLLLHLSCSEICVWDSENDTRKWNERTHKYEPLRKAVIRELKMTRKALTRVIKALHEAEAREDK